MKKYILVLTFICFSQIVQAASCGAGAGSDEPLQTSDSAASGSTYRPTPGPSLRTSTGDDDPCPVEPTGLASGTTFLPSTDSLFHGPLGGMFVDTSCVPVKFRIFPAHVCKPKRDCLDPHANTLYRLSDDTKFEVINASASLLYNPSKLETIVREAMASRGKPVKYATPIMPPYRCPEGGLCQDVKVEYQVACTYPKFSHTGLYG